MTYFFKERKPRLEQEQPETKQRCVTKLKRRVPCLTFQPPQAFLKKLNKQRKVADDCGAKALSKFLAT